MHSISSLAAEKEKTVYRTGLNNTGISIKGGWNIYKCGITAWLKPAIYFATLDYKLTRSNEKISAQCKTFQ